MADVVHRLSQAVVLATPLNTVAIVQARMGSTRLPGKVLEKIGDHTVILHVVKRVREAIPQVVVAIPEGEENTPLCQACLWAGMDRVDVFQGPEEDVLSRYYFAAAAWEADIIVRVTADCPCPSSPFRTSKSDIEQ